MADYYLDEEWCLKNKDTILPDKDDILSEYNSKLAHTKSLSGCSSCMVNSLKNRYISKLNDILSNARRIICRYNCNNS